MPSPLRSIRNIPRYQEIVRIFVKHGFGFVFEIVNLGILKPFQKRSIQAPDRAALENLPAHFRLALEELGPTFVKLGQVLSTRPDLLPPSFIAELAKLQDTVPPVDWDSIRSVIIDELGQDAEGVFYHIEKEPIAAASLAQVHGAILRTGERVVIKVQRPYIRKLIDRDLNVIADLAERFQTTHLGTIFDFVGIAEEFSFTLLNELDYQREGHNADRFRRNFKSESYLYIPKVYWEYSTMRLLVMERISGIKIDDTAAIDAQGYDRHELAMNAARIIIKEILEDGFFHADPHPGNLIIMPGHVIGAMDFGMVGYVNDVDRVNLIRLYAATVNIDIDTFIDQLIQMGGVDVRYLDRARLSRDVSRILNQFAGVPLRDVRAADLLEIVQSVMFKHHIRLPSNYWLLAKSLALMEGVGLKLDPAFDVFEVSRPYADKMLWHLLLPDRKLPETLLRLGKDWQEFGERLPRSSTRILAQAEAGNLFQVTIRDLNRILSQFDRIATRLSISIMLAAIIVGMAMLTPLFSNGSLVQWLLLLGFVSVFILGVWFLISMLRLDK